MRRTIVRLTGLTALGLSLLAAGAQTPPAVEKMTVLPSRLNTRLVLDTTAPLVPLASSFASPAVPAVLLVEFGPARWSQPPAVPADGSALLRGIQVRTKPNGRTVLALTLAERVPYRIASENSRTVIRLDTILRGETEYFIDAETERELRAGARPAVPIRNVEVIPGNGRLDVSARFGRKPVTNVFALDNPLRLVVDIFDAVYSGPTDNRLIGRLGVENLKVGQFMAGDPYTITRLVFDLREPRPYGLTAGAEGVQVSFGPDTPVSDGGEPMSAVEPPSAPPMKAEAKIPPAEKTGSGRNEVVNKPAADPPAVSPMKTEATIPPAEKQAETEKASAKMVYNPEQKYTGEVLSPRFKDADIRDVILYLGEEVGLNVIFDDEVRGTVTCSFDQIPWDQFLDIILKSKKLGKTLEGNVLRIAPMTTLTQEQADDQKLRDAQDQSGPLITKTYPLSYAKARDIEPLIKNKKSQRGEISIDDRTNTLILVDTREKLDLIEKLVEVLDTPTPQVSIEARIVEATSTFVRNLGIQWGARGIADAYYGNQTSLQFPNSILADAAIIPEGQVTKGIGGPLGGYAVNLPAPAFSSAIGFSFGNVLDTFRLDIALTAMETQGNGQIISSPKVTTQNNAPAEVIQGRQIPVQTQANFTVTTQYVPAALQLKATPQITAEGTIIMDLDIQNNAADFANLVNGIPPITTQSAKTRVMVPDGGTTVIGGIYRIEDSVTRERIPLLHQIPILGALFKNFARTKSNRELLIFITPRIIK